MAASQASNQGYDANEDEQNDDNHDLHLVVLPAHTSLELQGCVHKSVCLHQSNVSGRRTSVQQTGYKFELSIKVHTTMCTCL